ncbi:MAG TPA: NUDIX hydrolase [Micropepsaceae bacterium]|nr:NUDIX hydrolase [Micropepsaceae bacterium]
MNCNHPFLACDCVVFDGRGRLLLIRRKNEPYQGYYALPGGFMETGETAERAALRELKEETGLDASKPRLVGVYSDPKRDPRHHTVTITYLIFVDDVVPAAGDDAASAEFVENWDGLALAFDHAQMLRDALELRAKLAKGC